MCSGRPYEAADTCCGRPRAQRPSGEHGLRGVARAFSCAWRERRDHLHNDHARWCCWLPIEQARTGGGTSYLSSPRSTRQFSSSPSSAGHDAHSARMGPGVLHFCPALWCQCLRELWHSVPSPSQCQVHGRHSRSQCLPVSRSRKALQRTVSRLHKALQRQ